jgi:hypothetical protein
MCDTIQHVVEFRENLHRTFAFRSDATMDLIDAITGNTSAKSSVELSLSSLFPRQYSSLHDAVDNFLVPGNPGKAKEERHTQQQIRMPGSRTDTRACAAQFFPGWSGYNRAATTLC